MARLLIYTSAPKLLDAGRSGFGTVARAKSLSPLLVGAIERVSQFANHRSTDRTRVIFSHRRVTAANQRVHLLSRIADAGSDYTGRTNHLAQHLVVTQEEATHAANCGLTPADVLQQFAWRATWNEPAKFFTPAEDVALDAFHPPARNAARTAWSALTGRGIFARLLAWDAAPRTGVLLVPTPHDPLALLAESLAEAGPLAWQRTFTTSLESTDEMADFDWIVSSPEGFSEIRTRCGARTIYDLTQPNTLPLPSEAPAPSTPAVADFSGPNAADGLPTAADPTPIPPQNFTSPSPGRTPVPSPTTTPRRSPKPLPPAKSRSWMVLPACLMVAAVVLLGVLFWPNDSSSSGTDAPTAPPAISSPTATLSDAQRQAVKDLQKLPISQNQAEKLVNSTGQDAPKWVAFIRPFYKQDADSPLEPPPSAIPTGCPPWLESLVAAQKEYAIATNDATPPDARSTARKNYLAALQSASEDLPSLNVPSLTAKVPVPRRSPTPAAETPLGSVPAKIPPKPTGPDFSGIPAKSLLVLTQEQIRQGIEIPLIKAHLAYESSKQLIPSGISLTLGNGQLVPNRTLTWMEKGPWFDTSAATLKSSNDGRISAATPADADGLRITSTAGTPTRTTWLVLLDAPITTPALSDLMFSLVAINKDSVALTGELSEWLLALDAKTFAALKVVASDTPLNLQRSANAITLQRPVLPEPVNFSKKDIDHATDLLMAFKKAHETPNVGTQELKKKIAENKNKALEDINALIDLLHKGNPQMQRLPKLPPDAKLPEAENCLNPIIRSANARPPAPLIESVQPFTLLMSSGRVLFSSSIR